MTEAKLKYNSLNHNLTEELNALKISNEHQIEFYTVNNEALSVCIIIKFRIIKNIFVI